MRRMVVLLLALAWTVGFSQQVLALAQGSSAATSLSRTVPHQTVWMQAATGSGDAVRPPERNGFHSVVAWRDALRAGTAIGTSPLAVGRDRRPPPSPARRLLRHRVAPTPADPEPA
jgi:hypothetical protein